MADTTKETIERLQVEISANAEEFSKDMEAIKKQIAGLGSITKETPKSFNAMQLAMTKATVAGNVITAVIGKATRTFVGLGKTLIANGSQYSRISIATETVARNLGMTTEQINDLRDSLAESNTYGIKAEEIIKTLAMSGLVDMANGLRVVKADTDETIEGVGALVYTMKDLAAAAGVESAEGIDRVTKFIRRGEAAYADGIIEIGNLAGEYQAYATQLGKTASQLTAEERAQVRLNIVMREGEKAYGTYANTMQTSAKAWDSAKASIRTMTETLGSYLEPILSALANGFYQLTSGLRKGLLGAGDVIKSWATTVAAYITFVIQKLGALLSKIPFIGKYFTGMASFGTKSMDKMAGGANNLSKGMDNVKDSTNGAVKAMNKLASFDEMNVLEQDETGGSVGMAGIGGGDLSVNTEGFENAISQIKEKTDEIERKWSEFKDRVTKFFEPIADLWNRLVTPALDNFKKSFNNLLERLNSPVIQSFSDVLKIIATILAGAIVAAISVVIDVATIIVNVISTTIAITNTLVKIVGTGIGDIIAWITNLYNKFSNYISNWKTNTANVISNVWSAIKNTFSNIGSWFSDKFNSAVNGIKNAFSGIANFFGGVWNTIKSKFSEIGTKAGEVVGGAFKTVINGVLRAVESVINTPINAINSLIGKVKELTGINIGRLGNIYIPKLATGGVIDSPTVAMLGEAGREAVVPLENTRWIDELAEKINNTSGNQSITVKIGEETVYSGFVDYLNDKSLRTGTKLLNI